MPITHLESPICNVHIIRCLLANNTLHITLHVSSYYTIILTLCAICGTLPAEVSPC